MNSKPRIVDTFCGAGGFALGARAVGLAPSISFDIDPILTSSVKYNFPETELVLADLATISGSDIERQVGGQVDGIFGGPPCQAFSAMGYRQADDPRRSLLGHFFRLVSELRPAFFVLENVQGLTYPDALPVLQRGLDLLDGRYDLVGPMILDASDFGAATRRPRLFVIGYDAVRCDPISVTDIEKLKQPAATVADAISDLSTAVFERDEEGYDIWKLASAGSKSHYARRMWAPDLIFTGHRKTKHTEDVVSRFAALEPGTVDRVGRHPRLAWGGQCPTLRAGTGSDRGSFQAVRPVHPDEHRVITVREGARLQGFPDRFRFHSTVWHSFRMIGNSVSPIIAEAILSEVSRKIGILATSRVAAE
ncbi:DNA (cytosine-5-)-methyltransferase [Sinorhizobium meliloti]|nr:DNA (cytosine-5-)-methyltransferase [Sinorhizobium meliloti]